MTGTLGVCGCVGLFGDRARGDAEDGMKAFEPVADGWNNGCGITLELAPNWLLEPWVVLGHWGGAVERTAF